MKKIYIICLAAILLFAGCEKKDSTSKDTARSDGVFAYEKRVLLDMIDILEIYHCTCKQLI